MSSSAAFVQRAELWDDFGGAVVAGRARARAGADVARSLDRDSVPAEALGSVVIDHFGAERRRPWVLSVGGE